MILYKGSVGANSAIFDRIVLGTPTLACTEGERAHMQSKKNIFLIGFMGAGKSTVARYLHRQQGMNWLEMDKEIERKEGMPVSCG